MNSSKVYLLHSFPKDDTGGNPAGVVLDADDLTIVEKRQIAKEVGVSETAFVETSDKADYKVTFFTPNAEVPMCGHATIALFSLLFQKGIIKPNIYTLETNAGVLKIEVQTDGMVIMEQLPPIYGGIVPIDVVCSILHIDESLIAHDLLPEIVSTGMRDIFVPLKDRSTLFSLNPNLDEMGQYNRKTNTTGFHVFTLDTLEEASVAHARNFAPLFAIPEESATGSSTGALACYLWKYKQIDATNTVNMQFEQGFSMNQPSLLYATLEIEDGKISKVKVGGKAIISDGTAH